MREGKGTICLPENWLVACSLQAHGEWAQATRVADSRHVSDNKVMTGPVAAGRTVPVFP